MSSIKLVNFSEISYTPNHSIDNHFKINYLSARLQTLHILKDMIAPRTRYNDIWNIFYHYIPVYSLKKQQTFRQFFLNITIPQKKHFSQRHTISYHLHPVLIANRKPPLMITTFDKKSEVGVTAGDEIQSGSYFHHPRVISAVRACHLSVTVVRRLPCYPGIISCFSCVLRGKK